MASRERRVCAAAALVTLLAAACGQQPADAPDPGVGHIHGVGVDPADGAVYIAAHYGLFKVGSQSTATRVAGRFQDHMGFTVVGPKTFLASGHPSAADIAPGGSPHLGLIRTANGGVTWTPVSEAGTADFHALQPAGRSLYAYDTQTQAVRRSQDDGRTWVTGAKLQVIDLAASAAQPDVVYATTPEGLQVSSDAGASFAAVENAPLLSHADSPTKGVLIGVDAAGQLRTSSDAGKSWKSAGGLPGPATAFTAVDPSRLLASMEDGTVLTSDNGGRDFAVAFRPAAS